MRLKALDKDKIQGEVDMDGREKMRALARAVLAGTPVHYAPDGETPICGEDAEGVLCTHDPKGLVGCVPCLEVMAEDVS